MDTFEDLTRLRFKLHQNLCALGVGPLWVDCGHSQKAYSATIILSGTAQDNCRRAKAVVRNAVESKKAAGRQVFYEFPHFNQTGNLIRCVVPG